MVEQGGHEAEVNAWLERSATDLPPHQLPRLFASAFGALWRCARVPLGEITLTAITDRVLYNAAQKFPAFSSVRIEPAGDVQCEGLTQPSDPEEHTRLVEGIRFVLVEFLAVLGHLTAEILTAQLHDELRKINLDSTKTETARVDVLPGQPGRGPREWRS